MVMKSKLVAHEVNRQLCKVTDMFLAHMFGEIDTLPDDNNIYRVSMKHSPYIEVMCLGDGFVDSACDGMYHGVDALPDWVKERIATLMLCRTTPPMPTIDGVGRRISEDIFWVFAPATKVRDSLTKQEKEDE